MSAMRRMWQKLAVWWRERETMPAGETPWVARQVKVNAMRLEELEARLDAAEAEAAAARALRESGLEGVRRALTVAGVPVPDSLNADAPTQPIYLRAV